MKYSFKHTLLDKKIYFYWYKIEITIVTTSVGTYTNQRNWVPHLGLHHFNPPSLDSKLTRKRQAWEEHKVLQETKGCRLKYKLQQQWTIVFFLFNSSLFKVSEGFLIYLFNGVMEGRIWAISRHIKGQETSDLDPHQGKLENYLAFYTHPYVRGFKVQIHVYMRERD